MTTAVADPIQADSTLPDSFWDGVSDPVASDPPDENTFSEDKTEIVNPPEKTCATCGEPIIREPGSRGRLPKYHPECRPSRGSVSSGPRIIRATAAEKEIAAETEMALEIFQGFVMRIAIMVSMVDPYDAFVIMVNLPELLGNLRGLLMRFSWLRKEFVAIQTGGSILGLILTILSIALPIAAHHSLIPGKRVSSLLQAFPFFLQTMQERMAQGPEALARILANQVRLNAERQRQAQEAKAEEPDGD